MPTYTSPAYNAVNIDFSGLYTAPAFNAVNIDLSPPDGNLSPTGFAAGAIGAAAVRNQHEYLSPSGIAAGAIGSATVTSRVALSPSGFTDEAFGTEIITNAAHVNPSGFTSAAFGTAVLTSRATLLPSGLATEAFGTADAELHIRYLVPAGLAPGSFGTASILNFDQFVTITGISAGALGSLTIYNLRQVVVPVGFVAGSFGFVSGGGQIALAHRIIVAGAGDQGAVGTPRADTEDHTADLAGRGIHQEAFGTPFVAYHDRFIFPLGINSFNRGIPTVDKTHYVTGSGWDSSQFGTQYVHDNRQFPGPVGFDAARYGAASVTRSPRVVAPVGFPSSDDLFPSSRWGRPAVYNRKQIVYEVNFPSSDEGGVFGNPLRMLVENRNRTIGAIGIIPGRLGKAAFIENKARAVLATGWDSGVFGFFHTGLGFIAYRNRTVTPTDPIGPTYFSQWTTVSKPPQLFPVGIPPAGFGNAVWSNPPQNVRFTGHIDQLAFGTAFIAPRVRDLVVPLGPESFYGMPDVENKTRYLAPVSFGVPKFGTATLEIHFNIFYPAGWFSNRMGLEHYIRNLTPQIYPFGKDQAEFGRPEIRWNPYPLRPYGIPDEAWGRNVIEYRTKTTSVFGLLATRWGPNTIIYNDQPNPPSNRTFAASGFDMALLGTPSVRRNELDAIGWIQTGFGNHHVILQGAIVPSVQPEGAHFGIPRIVGPQYVFAVGLLAPDDPLSAEPKPKPRLSPYHIYASFSAPPGYASNNGGRWEYMDARFVADDGSDLSARPFFGLAFISNYRRFVFATGAADAHVGQPAVDLKNRVVKPNGIRPRGIGVPALNDNETLEVTYGPFSEAFGTLFVQLKNRTMQAQGFQDDAFGTAFISNFHRRIYPEGDDVSLLGVPRVHPPEPVIPAGFDASAFGTAYIDFRYRTLRPSGWEEFVSDYDIDDFDQRMRVTTAIATRHSGWLDEAFGNATVGRHRIINEAVFLRDTSA
jgi:hypothetical protein